MISSLLNPLIALCLIVFGVLLTYGGHKNGTEFSSLRDHGIVAEAKVTKLKWEEKKINHLDSAYSAYVRFTTEGGREVHEEIPISTEFGRSLRSQTIPTVMSVRYLPESPTTFRDVNETDSSDAQGAVGGYMLFAGIVMLLLRLFIRK